MAILRPEFGPTLPALAERRFGWPQRRTALLAVAALVVLAVAVRFAIDDGKDKVVVHGSPTFHLRYEPGLLHRVGARPGELLRLEGRTRRASASVVVRRLSLPPYDGDIAAGQLPVLAAQREIALRERLPGFVLLADAKERGIDEADGYVLRYRSGTQAQRTFWTELYELPEDGGAAEALWLTARQEVSGRRRGRSRRLLKATKDALYSFRFGAGRPSLIGG